MCRAIKGNFKNYTSACTNKTKADLVEEMRMARRMVHFIKPISKGRPHYGAGYRALLKWIRKTFPVKRGYRFKVVDELCDPNGNKVLALARYGDAGPYEIIVSKQLQEGQWEEAIIHEVSHVIDIDRNGPPVSDTHDACHRNSWGRAYSEIYRAFFRWQEGKDE